MMTEKCSLILSKMKDIHRQEFLENNPECNENDCERDFLYTVLLKVSSHKQSDYSRLSTLIETIR